MDLGSPEPWHSVYGGIFLGPFLARVLGPRAWWLTGALATVLVLGVLVAIVERNGRPPAGAAA